VMPFLDRAVQRKSEMATSRSCGLPTWPGMKRY
jgi:hypothetical protein